MKKYTFDETFFDKIDSEEKAYVLGFLYADGYNYEKRGVVTMSLQEKDKTILEEISNLIQSTKPLQFINMKKYHRGKSHQNQYRLNLCSRSTSEALSTLGCVQNKTYSCTFPPIANELNYHFIRGFFDGDGCISFTRNKQGRPCGSVSLVCSSNFGRSFCEHLKRLGVNTTYSNPPPCDERICRVSFGGRYQLEKFYNFIYNPANIFLKRKKDMFEKFFNLCQSHRLKTKSTNVYQNTTGSKLPFRVVKTLNYKTIHLGSFATIEAAVAASNEWDQLHGRVVTALN